MLVFRGSCPALLIAFAVLSSLPARPTIAGALDPERLPQPDAGDGAVIVPGDGGPSPLPAGRDPGGQAGRGGGRDAGPAPAPSCEENADGPQCNEDCHERCNGEDDDCDGEPTRTAPRRLRGEHALSVCDEGACLIVECQDDYRDCDATPHRLRDGARRSRSLRPCGHACDLPNAIEGCEDGECVAVGCEGGYGDCDGDRLSCETPLVGLEHCGGCDTACGGLDQASPQCDSGSCGVQACLGNFGDCDGDPDNGCETTLDTLDGLRRVRSARAPRRAAAAACAPRWCARTRPRTATATRSTARST